MPEVSLRDAARPGVFVEIDEPKITASQQGADWWLWYRKFFDRTGRITLGDDFPTPMGVRCLVACDDIESAEHLVRTAVEHGGVPKSAVRVLPRLTAARSSNTEETTHSHER